MAPKAQTKETVDGPHANTLPAQASENAQQDNTSGGEVMVQQPGRPKPPLVAGRNGVMAIIPADIDQAYRLASAIAAADMAPKSYGRDANKIMIGIMHGMEVGFTPMAALQSIAVINGMPSIWGDGALALIEASGLLEDKVETITVDDSGGMVASCKMKRKGRSWTEQTFSWQDAQIAKLITKDTYKLYGRRMLQRRARAWCMTDGFSDVLRGLHIREAADLGSLVEAAGGTYVPEQTQEAEARPTRETPAKDTKADKERIRKVAVAQDKQYRDMMAAESRGAPQGQDDDETPHDHETGEVDESAEVASGGMAEDTENQTQTVKAEATPAAATSDHATMDSMLRRKIMGFQTVMMVDSALTDWAPELEAMRLEDAPRWKALMEFKADRLKALKKK